MANDVVSNVIIDYKSTGADQVNADLKKTQDNLSGVSTTATGTERATASLENRFKSLERQLGTTAGNEERFQRIQDQVNKAVAQNPELQGRANELLAAAAARYGQLGEATKGLDAQGQAALHSIRSLVEQVAMGASPMQALTAQMNHLSFAASGEGGIVGAFRQVGTMVAGLVTPTTAAIAAAGALTVALGAVAIAYDKVQKSADKALIGAGQRTGTTISDINQFASQNQGLVGGLSQKEATQLGQDLTKTGDIVISKLHDMGTAVVGFAEITGKSMDDASKAMVEFATDPKKAMDDLAKVYGDFDAKTKDLVDGFVLLGDKTSAFQTIIDALAEKNKRAADTMGALETGARTLVNILATGPRATGIEQQLNDVKQKLNDAIEFANSALGKLVPGAASTAVENLSRQFEELQAKMQKVQAAQAADQMKKLATAADDVTKSIIPQIDQIQKLEQEIAALQRAMSAGAKGQDVSQYQAALTALQNQKQALVDSQAQAERYNQQVAQIAQSWGNVSQQVALQLQALQNELPVLQAITGQEQQAAQYAANYTNAIQQGRTETEAAALASAQLAASEAQATSAVQRQVEALQDSTRMIKAQQNGTEATTAASIAYKNAIESGADATAASAMSSATLANYAAKAAASTQQMEAAAWQAAAAWEAADRAASKGSFDFSPDPSLTEHTGASVLTPQGQQLLNAKNALDAAKASGDLQKELQISQQNAMLGSQYYTAAQRQQMGLTLSPQDEAKLKQAIVDAAVQSATSAAPNTTAGLQSLATSLVNNNITDPTVIAKALDLQSQIATLQKQPETLARDTTIAQLQNSLDALIKSTDQLNATNQDLLSPYYTQDPRVSHIGFRSQGMAQGGYVDVPGATSANDNMIAVVPVASGERIYVDPMYSRRGLSAGANFTINVSSPVMFAGNVNPDQVGRTMYQNNQNLVKQLRSAMQ